MAETRRHPLHWPDGWPRTPFHTRARAHFGTRPSVPEGQYALKRDLSVNAAIARLRGELRRLGVLEGDWILSTNVKVRLDGLPYGSEREPNDPGAAVYFRLAEQDRVLACDTWTRVADNIGAIAWHVAALRAIERYGVGSLDRAFAGYAALPAKGQTWRTTLGFGPDDPVTHEAVDAAFRRRARESHPDIPGGSHDAMASLSAAKQEAYRSLGPRA